MPRRAALLAAGQRYRTANSVPLALFREVLSQSAVAAVTLTTGAGTQVGDQLVCIRMADAFTDSTILVAPTGTAGTWAQQGADSGSAVNSPRLRVWTRLVTVGGAQTVTCATTAKANHVVLYVLPAGRAVNDVQLSFGATDTATRSAPSVTSAGDAALICCGAEYDAPTFAGYSGALVEDAEIVSNASTAWAASERVSTGATGSRTVTKTGASPWWVTASIAASAAGSGGGGGGSGSATRTVVATVTAGGSITPGGGGAITLTPTQPCAFVYSSSTASGYNHPGALVIVGRTNYADQAFKDISTAGGTVLVYLDAIVWNNFGLYHGLLFNSSAYGAAVPEWPGPVNANAGGNLADFRVGSLLLTKLPLVLQRIVDDNPHIGGFFADDLGSRSWFPGFDWTTFGTTNQNSYRAGAIAVAQAFRDVCNTNGLITICNGTWENGSTAASGGGYPTQNAHGCSLMEGGTVEHHATADAFWQGYISTSGQWGSASPITGAGKPVMVVIGSASGERQQWVDLNVAYYTTQTDYGSSPTAWGSFHATGLPSHA
jgi:hypothetical protein